MESVFEDIFVHLISETKRTLNDLMGETELKKRQRQSSIVFDLVRSVGEVVDAAETMGVEINIPSLTGDDSDGSGKIMGNDSLEPLLSETAGVFNEMEQTTDLEERKMQSQIVSNLACSLSSVFDMLAAVSFEMEPDQENR
jgi:hypothetical protein